MRGIVNGRIITVDNVLVGKVILFEKKIIDIIDEDCLEQYKRQNSVKYIDIIDAKGNYVSPGFIDIHIHGAGGCDTMDGSIEGLTIISRTLSKSGVTSFLPTTMTMEKEKIYKALEVIKNAKGREIGGARVLGAHLEGPFINEAYKGAQSEKFIVEPSFEFIEEYLDVIKIVTLAPEKDKDHKFIKQLKESSDIVISMGHTNAEYEEAEEAISEGVTHATHIFNAMSPLNHRKPGAVGAIFNSNVSCEIIADTIHVHPGIFKLLIKIKGKEKIVLITDSMRAGAMKEGIYDLGGQDVDVKNNSARLKDGTLAGSILSLDIAIINILEHTKLTISEVIAMVTLNPAKVLHLENSKGTLEKGKDADITIFDEKATVYVTIVGGENVFETSF
ncbi:N-acetylglucosamine-6-phosphate deacetylase [Clostridium cellulovorans]|uniref:N-acetylglucosamine-6-phosphate deacetylase n=1 Tax=Clostridium cellulovorans (strain ATCC 35296 / DSM 3052 / OCM 3 / 743B) TaxID=573061 RepID=D9SSX5_CLOC7|nr:N-acetylglucosamine-6-phosphate deacetylase [Clostridium cellulovorans]ADL52637.1 N-acetylglucosamine-6-phosphate deacetylase [Clostridium cellulovorans 743B]